MIDTLTAGIKQFDLALRAAAKEGLAQAGMRLLADCSMEMPKTPHKEGTLRGSGSVHVNGVFAYSSDDDSGPDGKPTPNKDAIPYSINPNLMIGTVAFNTPYAAWLHEGVDLTFHEAGTGAKYLEKKLVGNSQRYMDIVGNAMAKRGFAAQSGNTTYTPVPQEFAYAGFGESMMESGVGGLFGGD